MPATTRENLFVAASNAVLASGTADGQIVAATSDLRLVGFSVTETDATATSAELAIRHGASAGDTILYRITLAADESTSEWMGPDGIACPNGLFIDRVSGTTEVIVFTKTIR